jgi:hypothetical protein
MNAPETYSTLESSPELLQARLDKAVSDLQRLEGERNEYKRQFDMVIASASWSVTSPLRRISKLVKWIWPLTGGAPHSVKLSVYRNLEEREGRFVIVGPDPAFDLTVEDVTDSKASFKKGWYSIDANVSTPKGALYFFLYLGRDSEGKTGFSEMERFLLSFDHGKRSQHLINLPDGIHSLRLQVYDFEGDFSISDVHLRPLGSLNILTLLFGKQVLPLLTQPRVLLSKARKAFYCVREGGLPALKAKLFGGRITNNYGEWVGRFDSFTTADREAVAAAADALSHKPKISIITPVFNPPIQHFRACLDQLRHVNYSHRPSA